MSQLRYRAGARALRRLRERGFSLGDVRGFVLPATGPRWLVAAGFDRALIDAGFAAATGGSRTLLIGASAGSWRSLALAATEPVRAQRALIDAYCRQRFRRSDSASHVSRAYLELLGEVFQDADLGHALEHPAFDLAVTVVRARRWGAQWARARMLAHLAGAATLNLVWRDATQWFFERVVFHTPRVHTLLGTFRGERVPLTVENVRGAALASGTVPMYMEPVLDLAGAGPGGYLDGGLADYHVNQPLCTGDGVILMFSHQPRIVPGWFDKSLGWRKAVGCEDVLLVHPDPAWIASLPGARVPTRDDFFEFEHAPDERSARWLEVAARSQQLGETFEREVASGGIVERLEAL